MTNLRLWSCDVADNLDIKDENFFLTNDCKTSSFESTTSSNKLNWNGQESVVEQVMKHK